MSTWDREWEPQEEAEKEAEVFEEDERDDFVQNMTDWQAEAEADIPIGNDSYGFPEPPEPTDYEGDYDGDGEDSLSDWWSEYHSDD